MSFFFWAGEGRGDLLHMHIINFLLNAYLLTLFYLVYFVAYHLLVMKQNLQVDELNLADIGPKFEHHAMFPARTNTGQFLSLLQHKLCLLSVRD